MSKWLCTIYNHRTFHEAPELKVKVNKIHLKLHGVKVFWGMLKQGMMTEEGGDLRMSKEVVVTVCKQRTQDNVENRDLRINQTKVKWGCTKCTHTT